MPSLIHIHYVFHIKLITGDAEEKAPHQASHHFLLEIHPPHASCVFLYITYYNHTILSQGQCYIGVVTDRTSFIDNSSRNRPCNLQWYNTVLSPQPSALLRFIHQPSSLLASVSALVTIGNWRASERLLFVEYTEFGLRWKWRRTCCIVRNMNGSGESMCFQTVWLIILFWVLYANSKKRKRRNTHSE